VLLNMALINYAMSFLIRRGYTPVQTPFFMRKVRFAFAVHAHCAMNSRRAGSHVAPACSGVHERVRSAGGL